MGYRPLTDIWILARAKLLGGHKFYGSWPGGALERCRVLIGAGIDDPVLHVCGGKSRHYPYKRGFGPNDRTLDLDPSLEPNYHQDARDPWPLPAPFIGWKYILADPPYSAEEATNYAPGSSKYPTPGAILARASEALAPGGRVGIIHYIWPKPPADLRCLAVTGVLVGYNNRIRVFSVYEKARM
jgi:hypothetical protein